MVSTMSAAGWIAALAFVGKTADERRVLRDVRSAPSEPIANTNRPNAR